MYYIVLLLVNMQEHPLYAKLRFKTLSFKEELDALFKDVMAMRKFSYAPSSRTLSNPIQEIEDLHRPSFENDNVDLEEALGDSEELVLAAARVSFEVRNINLSTS